MDLDTSSIALWGHQQEKFLKRTTTGHTGIVRIEDTALLCMSNVRV